MNIQRILKIINNKKLKKIILALFFLSQFIISPICAQKKDKILDSLKTTLKTTKHDTNYIKNLISISQRYNKISNYIEAKSYARQAITKSEEIKYKKGINNSYNTYAAIYYSSSSFDSSLVIYYKLIKLVDTIKDYPATATLYSNIGNVYYRKSDFNLALSYLIKSLKINEKINDTTGIIYCYDGISSIYSTQNNYKKALETNFKALDLVKNTINKKYLPSLASVYNTLGVIYASSKNNDKAIFYYLKSLAIKENLDRENSGYKKTIAVTLVNLCEVYTTVKKYDEALIVIKKALKIREEIDSKLIIASSNVNLGFCYHKLNKPIDAEKCYKISLKIAREIGYKNLIKEIYTGLSNLYEDNKDFKEALVYQKLYSTLKDSLYNTESSKQINEMNTKYETEKKDKELIKKDAEISMQQVQTEKQAVIKNGFIIGFVFLLGLIIFIYRSYTQKQKINLLLNEKNQKITDSINYAKIIQTSILPSLDEMKKHLPESFIFYQPKDIVSGDFYWLYPINEYVTIFAIVDCTGHGVPGALMSMLGYSLLEQIINQNKISKPAEILDQLNHLVIESLKQSENGDTVKNGMDMVIFKLDYNTYELEFAGAKNPLYIIRDQNLIELKGDRKSIGLSSGNTTPFTNHQLKLQPSDCIYGFSDGYIDQKGGAENKKFYSSTFQKLLININMLNANEQHEQVKAAFTNWKGSKEQMDDVLVFGVKV